MIEWIIGGAVLLLLKKKGGAGTSSSSAGGGAAGGAKKTGPDVDKLAAQADSNFAAALGAAHGIVTASGALTGPGGAAAVQPYLAIVEPQVALAWHTLPKKNKADIFAGGDGSGYKLAAQGANATTQFETGAPKQAPDTKGLAGTFGTLSSYSLEGGLGLFTPTPASTTTLGPGAQISQSRIPGCSNPPPGFQSLVCYIANQIASRLHQLVLALCKSADAAAAALRKKGINIPGNWESLSCDQKDAFLLALAPFIGVVGPALLVAGAVSAAINSKETKALAKSVSKAAATVGGDVQAAVKGAADAVSNAASSAESAVKKIF